MKCPWDIIAPVATLCFHFIKHVATRRDNVALPPRIQRPPNQCYRIIYAAGFTSIFLDPTLYFLILVLTLPSAAYRRLRWLLLTALTAAQVAAEPTLFWYHTSAINKPFEEAEREAAEGWWAPVFLTMAPLWHNVLLSTGDTRLEVLRLSMIHGVIGARRLPAFLRKAPPMYGGLALTLQLTVGIALPLALVRRRRPGSEEQEPSGGDKSGEDRDGLESIGGGEAPQSEHVDGAPRLISLQQWAEEFHGIEPDDITPEVYAAIVANLHEQAEAQGFPTAMLSVTLFRGCLLMAIAAMRPPSAADGEEVTSRPLTVDLFAALPPELRRRIAERRMVGLADVPEPPEPDVGESSGLESDAFALAAANLSLEDGSLSAEPSVLRADAKVPLCFAVRLRLRTDLVPSVDLARLRPLVWDHSTSSSVPPLAWEWRPSRGGRGLDCVVELPPLPAPSTLMLHVAYLRRNTEHFHCVLPFSCHLPVLTTRRATEEARAAAGGVPALLASLIDVARAAAHRPGKVSANWSEAAESLHGRCVASGHLALASFLEEHVVPPLMGRDAAAALERKKMAKIVSPFLVFRDKDLEARFLRTVFLPHVLPIHRLTLLMTPLILAFLIVKFQYSLTLLICANLPGRIVYAAAVFSGWSARRPGTHLALTSAYQLYYAMVEGVACEMNDCAKTAADGNPAEAWKKIIGGVVGFCMWTLSCYPSFASFVSMALAWSVIMAAPLFFVEVCATKNMRVTLPVRMAFSLVLTGLILYVREWRMRTKFLGQMSSADAAEEGDLSDKEEAGPGPSDGKKYH